jgi:hypothetical protein
MKKNRSGILLAVIFVFSLLSIIAFTWRGEVPMEHEVEGLRFESHFSVTK